AARDHKQQGARVDLMDTATGKPLRRFDLADSPGGQMRFTPDGKSLVFSSWFNVTQCDLATGKPAWSINNATNSEAFALSANGKYVACKVREYAKSASVRVWNTTTGKEVAVLPGRGAVCRGLTFSTHGKRLLLWSLVPASVEANSITLSNDSRAI